MIPLLANASPASPFAGNLSFPLVAIGAAAVAGGLAFVIIRTVRVRHHPLAQFLIAASVLWAAAAAASVIWYEIQTTKWSSEESIRLGVGDADADKDAPVPPVPLWIGLGCAYPLLLMGAFSARRDA